MPLWLAFVIGVVISWGAYVPVLHEGQSKLGGAQGPGGGSLRAFLLVGVAYFVTAVVIPLILLFFKAGGEKFEFNVRGTSFAFLGGLAGAAGALCIILALKSGGKPLYVVPLVFAGAPVMSTIISMLWHPPENMPGPLFYLGIVMAAAGAGLVLYSRPQAKPHGPAPSAQVQAHQGAAPAPLSSEP
jgi:uncharacterized membrane protein